MLTSVFGHLMLLVFLSEPENENNTISVRKIKTSSVHQEPMVSSFLFKNRVTPWILVIWIKQSNLCLLSEHLEDLAGVCLMEVSPE